MNIASLSKWAMPVLLAILLAANAWAAWRYWSAYESVQVVMEYVSDIEEMESKISALRNAPLQVQVETTTNESLAQLVEDVATASGLGSDRIVHVSPAAPRRVGDTDYLEQITGVELREVSLKQLIQFALAVPHSNAGLHVPAVTIRQTNSTIDATNYKSDHEFWNVQLTLTTRSHAPKIPPRQ